MSRSKHLGDFDVITGPPAPSRPLPRPAEPPPSPAKEPPEQHRAGSPAR